MMMMMIIIIIVVVVVEIMLLVDCWSKWSIFSARQHIRYSALYAIARPSVCLSATRVDQSKTVEVRITQLSPQSSPTTLVS